MPGNPKIRDREEDHQVLKSQRHVRAAEARKSFGARSGESHPNFRHGGAGSGEYNSWCGARARCHDSQHPRYAEWGGRGVRMCERWRESFAAFVEDMGARPERGMSLDRIDSARGYEPGNCRWATAEQQSANRPTFVRSITYDGKTQTLSAWAREIGLSRKSLEGRLASWSVEAALTTPKGKKR